MKNIAAILFIGLITVLPLSAKAEIVQPSVLISELQTGGCVADGQETCVEDGRKEFIELHNPNLAPVSLAGWKVEYLSSSHDGTGSPTRIIAQLNGHLDTQGYILLSYQDFIEQADFFFGADSSSSSGLLAKTGGHIRVVDVNGAVVGQVGWGSAKQIANYPRTVAITPAHSIKQILASDPLYSQPWQFSEPSFPTTPQGGDFIEEEPTQEPMPLPCDQLIISEILPNPDGNDKGQEFIELFNSSPDPVQLQGCSLRLGDDSTKSYDLPDEVLQPGQFRAFYDHETGLTLPNSTSVVIWLVSNVNEVANTYVDALGPNEAWALINGSWSMTNRPTPGAENLPPVEEPEEPIEEEHATSPKPCQPGQERNPATNRCRAIVTTANVLLTPCKTNQVRNPQTNRCKAVAGATTTLKPCDEGYERNIQTNRCRKTLPSSSLASINEVKDVPSPQNSNPWRWLIGGTVLTAALGYGTYEWRDEIRRKLLSLKNAQGKK